MDLLSAQKRNLFLCLVENFSNRDPKPSKTHRKSACYFCPKALPTSNTVNAPITSYRDAATPTSDRDGATLTYDRDTATLTSVRDAATRTSHLKPRTSVYIQPISTRCLRRPSQPFLLLCAAQLSKTMPRTSANRV